MQISVIIPSWNRAGQLARALDSVFAQERAPHEIIVVDDGSTDHTRELVTRRFGDVRYLYQQNRGVSSARNAGIRAATGNWIALLDSDDCWHPDKLARQQAALHASPNAVLCHSDEIWVRNGRRVNPMRKHAKQGGRIFRHCLPLCPISPSASLIRRDIFDSIGLFDETLPACEDYDLWLRICAVHPVLYVDAPLITKYGGHDDQLSRRYWGMDRFRIQALENILAAGQLNPGDQAAARAMLLKKATIVARGAEKHGNSALAHRCREILRCHGHGQPPPAAVAPA
jgi:glycosyltransferase involved in cell wall biosynthesis